MSDSFSRRTLLQLTSAGLLSVSGCLGWYNQQSTLEQVEVWVFNQTEATQRVRIQVEDTESILVFDHTFEARPEVIERVSTELTDTEYRVRAFVDGKSVQLQDSIWTWKGCPEDAIMVTLQEMFHGLVRNRCYSD